MKDKKDLIKVGYVAGSWATNIGNSFYNLGALWLLKKLYGSENVFLVPDPPQVYWNNVVNDYSYIKHLDLDLFVFSGPIFNVKIMSKYLRLFDSLHKANKRIGFISTGSAQYSEQESIAISRMLNRYHLDYVFTRDLETFELYRNKLNCKVFDGICTSMFLNDAINVPNINDEYFVFNFDRKHEPHLKCIDGIINVSHNKLFRKQKKYENIKIIRTVNRSFIPNIKYLNSSKILYSSENSYYSDLPYGYFAILKNAKIVFSDRVHTCAATIILGGQAMYIKNSKRSNDGRFNIFNRIGCEKIFSEPISINRGFISNEKQKMIDQIKTIVKDH
jgi:hypothetical protein